jgi:hypothetical protein
MSRDFTPSEAVALGRLIEARHRAKIAVAKSAWSRRAVMSRPDRYKGTNRAVVELDEPERCGNTMATAARAVGMGRSKYDQAKKVVAAAESDPVTFGDLPGLASEQWQAAQRQRRDAANEARSDAKKEAVREQPRSGGGHFQPMLPSRVSRDTPHGSGPRDTSNYGRSDLARQGGASEATAGRVLSLSTKRPDLLDKVAAHRFVAGANVQSAFRPPGSSPADPARGRGVR